MYYIEKSAYKNTSTRVILHKYFFIFIRKKKEKKREREKK